ncbi:MAG TPA: hypothetical protein VM008_21910 [Phycisphaerae bacterium]|nr:hypothetical protein [Phycisphaerae bacterium]
MKELLEILKIVVVCVAGAVVYGIVHDQITARVCVEYFSVAHPPVFGDIQSPTLLGLGWGVIATWWVGAILGVPLGICARVGSLPKVGVRGIFRVLVVMLGILLVVAMVSGWCGYEAYEGGAIRLPKMWEERIPVERHARFMFDACAHLASYGVGALMGMGMWVYVLGMRWRERKSDGRQSGAARD